MFLLGFYTTRGQGDSLFQIGAYELAAVSYELAYFTSGNEGALIQKSECYKQLGEYDQALRAVERVNGRETNYEQALLLYLSVDYERSYNKLLQLSLQSASLDQETAVLMALVLIAKQDFQEVKKYLVTHQGLIGLDQKEIDLMFSKKLKYKKPNKAYNLSLWMPGIGQMYAGHFGKGLVSGGLVAGATGFTLYSLLNRYYFSGVLTGAALFYTFYLGGARYAGQLAEQKNEKNAKALKHAFSEGIKKAELKVQP
ncbi:MAG: TM2 domain-containing membrane protein YozV [Cyclobacteriaceae bacterium]|jgi:TM2 domain-containing membrane protein YozV